MSEPLGPDVAGSYETDIAAMHLDAGTWSGAADRMAGAAAAAQQLVLGDDDFSAFGVDSGLAAAYREMQGWASGLLTGARTNLSGMAQALTASAESYRAQEASNAQSFGQLDPGGN